MNSVMKRMVLISFLYMFIFLPLQASTFTETFDSDTFNDTSNTTAYWDTSLSRASLNNVTRFAQTLDVTHWGGGMIAIDYGPAGKWLIAGAEGKLNEYDGIYFKNRTQDLAGFDASNIRTIKNDGTIWLIGGDGPNLNSWDGNDTFTDIRLSLVNFSSAVNSIDYNPDLGNWLIGGDNGSLNKWNGSGTWTDLKSGLDFEGENVKAVSYGNGYWLIGGTQGKVALYNGLTFTDLTAQLYTAWGNSYYDVYTIDYNETDGYWLVAGGGGKIAVFDGSNFTQKNPGGTGFTSVWSVKWNGSYWLIGGGFGSDITVLYTTEDARVTPYTQQSNPSYFNAMPIWVIGSDMQASPVNMIGGYHGRMIKRTGTYNSPVNTDMSDEAIDFGANAISSIAYNGSYWLIGGILGSLNKYDGSVVSDLRNDLGWTMGDVTSIAWNSAGGYWLIGGSGGKIARYDGTTFYDRTTALGFGTSDVKTIRWNGSQWLVGGKNRKLAQSSDGDSFSAVDISSYFGSTESVKDVEWDSNSSLWFAAGENGKIITYDGVSAFNDLSSALSSCLGGTYTVNALKYNSTDLKMRIGCSGAKLSDYVSGGFVDKSSSLINFQGEDIYSIENAPLSEEWMIAGASGKINIAKGSGPEVFTDESGNLENFTKRSIRTIGYNGEFWIIAGDSAKLNKYGLSYVSPGYVYSKEIDNWYGGYYCVTLTSADTLNNQVIQYGLSSNDGATWLSAASGNGVCFSGGDSGDTLKWRAQLVTYDGSKSPFIDTVSVEYERIPAPTFTTTPTHSVSPTVTITISETVTQTVSESATPTISESTTQTITASITQSVTATITGTITQTNTASVSPSITASATQTVSVTVTATVSSTLTVSPTDTITPTLTCSDTTTATATVTQTFSVTQSITMTLTVTTTPTVTGTLSKTVTPTLTGTATETVTHTVSETITRTITVTFTWTITQTWSVTPTITITFITTPTATLTVIPAFEAVAEHGVVLFPNPADDIAKISYNMEESGKVIVRIYNEGGMLAAVFDEYAVKGINISYIETSSLSPGVYYYILSLEYDSGKREKYKFRKFLIIH